MNLPNFHNVRSAKGKFIPRRPSRIVPGRLYGFRGAVVRAGSDTLVTNTVRRHVSFHKILFGYVPETELTNVDRSKVAEYLAAAQVS